MDEDEIYEGLGLEAPEETPEGGETPSQSGPEDQPAPPEGEPEETETGAEEPPSPAPAAPETPPTQGEGLEAARRAAEDEAYRAAFSGKLNPYTNRPILSKADYDQYQEALRADQQRQQREQLRRAGVDPAAIQSIIDQHPVVRQAQEVIRQAETERVRAQEVKAREWYAGQLREIGALDPEVKSLDDLAARHPEQYPRMLEMVSRGVPLVDAYKAINFDTLVQRRAAAAQQAQRNQAAGKAHLAPTGGQGKGGVEVPGEVRQMYRDLNPDMSDADIRKEYAAYLKETGG